MIKRTNESFQFHLRPIKRTDNSFLAQIIRDCFIELNAPKEGTVYSDPTTDELYQLFKSEPNSACFVAESREGEILGLCGIYPTEGLSEELVELVKLYLKPSFRSLGVGEKLFLECLKVAKLKGYSTVYIETENTFDKAIKLYEKHGFIKLESPMGNSGHHNCNIWLTKELQ